MKAVKWFEGQVFGRTVLSLFVGLVFEATRPPAIKQVSRSQLAFDLRARDRYRYLLIDKIPGLSQVNSSCFASFNAFGSHQIT
jgi:hypothetical protein